MLIVLLGALPFAMTLGWGISTWTLVVNFVASKVISDTLNSRDVHINATHYRQTDLGDRFWWVWGLNSLLLLVFANGPLLFAIAV